MSGFLDALNFINHSSFGESIFNAIKGQIPDWFQHANTGWTKQIADVIAPDGWSWLGGKHQLHNAITEALPKTLNIIEGTGLGAAITGLTTDYAARAFTGKSLGHNISSAWRAATSSGGIARV